MRVSQFYLWRSISICSQKTAWCRSIATELVARGDSYNIQYHFSRKTLNTPLRHHIEVRHVLPYLEQAEKQGWAIKLKSIKATFISGYTFKTLKHVLTQPGVKLDALPPPPTPDPSNHVPTGIVSSQQPAIGANLPPFTIDGLKDYIVRYLVANDLVHGHYYYQTSVLF